MIPFSQVEISDPNKLFGRKELIDKLLLLANRHDNVSIIGTRRFGKTCLLKCIETALKQDKESTSYPIYFDFKQVGSIINGTDNVYKYMTAVLTETLFNNNHFTQEETFKNVKIQPSGDWADIYEQIADLSSVKTQGLFTEIIMFFAELLGKTILFLIDEYEYLFKYSLDRPEGFMNMRTLSTKSLENGLRPFSFWIAGAVNWDDLCTITGSGELNVINQTESITPIDKLSFNNMWEQEISEIIDIDLKTLLQQSLEFAYFKSGGVPYYAKHIGGYILVEKKTPSYSILKSYFQEIENSSLHLEEKKILNEIAKCPQNIKKSKHFIELINKGLVKQSDNKREAYEISIGFYRDYLIASSNDTDRLKLKLLESQELVRKITNLIESINKTLDNKKKPYIFDLVNDSASLENDLRTPCFDKEKFADFASALYKIYFERTKANDKKGEKLPNTSFKSGEFAQIVDILRHTFGGGHLIDKFNQQKGKITKAEMLESLIGSKNEPHSAEDFNKLQIEILKRFEKELDALFCYVKGLK